MLRRCGGVLLTSLALLLLCAADVRAANTPADGSAPSGAPEIDRATFDHLTTGFELIGQHRDLPCESCHYNAVFQGTPRDCATCHGMGSQVHATGKPITHILTSNRCESCHTPVAFSPAVNFDHAEVRGSCSSCHNGVQAQGKGPTHIDTSLECDACHSTIGWAGAMFNHNGIISGCASCHNNVSASGLPPTHIPTAGAACEACHIPTQYSSFAGATMNHPAVTPPMPCADCHEAGKSFVGVTIVTRPPAPHPMSGDCGTWHLATVSFNSGTMMPAGHIPTSQPCTLCHSNPSDFSVYLMLHDGISSGCATCHAAGLSFANMAPPVLVEPPANHIAFASAACESCHAVSNFTTFVVSNKSPPMNHAAVASLSCASCHGVGLSWAGTPTTVVEPANHVPIGSTACTQCHLAMDFTSFVIANAVPPMNHTGFETNSISCHVPGQSWIGTPAVKTLPATHIPTGTVDCATCHSNSNFSTFVFANASGTAPPSMVHSAVSSVACSSCHEMGLSWIGAPATLVRPATKADGTVHVVGGECSTCHFNTTSFKGATDLPSNHIPLPAADNNSCVLCHANLNDYSVSVMNHVNIASNCAQCHGAGKSFANMAPPTLKLPPSNHIPIGTASCESCHSTSNFTSFVIANAVPPMNHAGFTTNCISCHGPGQSWIGTPTVKTLPATHIPTGTVDCASCHSNSNFSSFVFANASGTAPPSMVHSAVSSVACSSCHEKGLSWIGAPATLVRPATKADGTAHVAAGECSTCHFNTTSFKGATDLPSNHIPLPSGPTSNCAPCHSNPSNFAVYAMDHSVVTGTACAVCHGAGKTFANMAPPTLKLPPSNHIPIGTAACESCHSATNFTTFMVSNKSPPMDHASVTALSCAGCHGSGLNFVGTPAVVVLPGTHVPVGATDCALCHSSSNFSSFVFANASGTAPPSMVHSAVSSVACSSCHEMGLSWIGAPATVVRPALKADGTAHVVGGECSTCHFNTTSFKGATDLPSNHIPLPAADNNSCVLCHANASDYSVSVMNHVNIASNCAQCHGAGKSFANMAPPTLKLPPSNHIPIGTAACESCHSATMFTSFVISNKSPPMDHAAVTTISCATCHAPGMSWVGTPATVLEPGNHIPIGNTACTNCHSATVFTSFVIPNAVPPMDHTGFTSGCITCHGLELSLVGTPAVKTLPATHIPTGTIACEGCHSNSSFSSFMFANASGTAPASMGHSLVTSIVCSTCHEKGLSWIGTPPTLVRPALKADGTAHVAAGECSTCHFNTTSFKGATDLPANHIPLPAADSNTCVLCHATAGNYSLATMNHVNIASNCVQCHGAGKSFANIAPPTLVLPPANHIPFGTAACESCHSATVFTTFVMTNKSPPMNHAVVASSSCQTCHALALTWAGTPATKVVPANHIPIGATACINCHSATNFATFVIANAVPPMNHTGFTTGCVNCHGAGKTDVGTAPKITVTLPANHIPTGTMACEGCHSSSSFNSFSFTNASGTAPPSMVHS